MFGRLPVKLT